MDYNMFEWWNFECLNGETLNVWMVKLWMFECWNFECWNFECLNGETLNVWMVKLWMFEWWNFECWNFECLNGETLNVLQNCQIISMPFSKSDCQQLQFCMLLQRSITLTISASSVFLLGVLDGVVAPDFEGVVVVEGALSSLASLSLSEESKLSSESEFP